MHLKNSIYNNTPRILYINYQHVSSHQDYFNTVDELSDAERNNVKCDEEAKNISSQTPSQELPTTLPFELHICLASTQGLVLENIYEHLASSVYLYYIQNHVHLSPSDIWEKIGPYIEI